MIGEAQSLWGTLPATPASHAPLAIWTVSGCPIHRHRKNVIARAFLCQLPRISDHVAQPEGVGAKRSGRRRVHPLIPTARKTATAHVSAVVCVFMACRIAPWVRTDCSRARSIFPFWRAQEPIAAGRLSVEPLQVGLRIVPGDAHSWVISALFGTPRGGRAGGVLAIVACGPPAGACESRVLLGRHFNAAHGEVVGQGDAQPRI